TNRGSQCRIFRTRRQTAEGRACPRSTWTPTKNWSGAVPVGTDGGRMPTWFAGGRGVRPAQETTGRHLDEGSTVARNYRDRIVCSSARETGWRRSQNWARFKTLLDGKPQYRLALIVRR